MVSIRHTGRLVIFSRWDRGRKAHRSYVGGDQKQQGVRGDMQVKVYQTMNQDPTTSDKARDAEEEEAASSRCLDPKRAVRRKSLVPGATD